MTVCIDPMRELTHIDNRLLARCDDAGKIAILVAQASVVVDSEVAPVSFVAYDRLNTERLQYRGPTSMGPLQ